MRQGQIAWWQSGVVYQIYPRSFRDSNGDGTGDLVGVREKIEYLSETLGVDAMWLSPFYPSPMADFGYDVADYTGVDPLFGTLADIDALIAAAHERGIAVIIDFVPNHSSDQHPWFRASRSSRADPKRDWYVWRDPKQDGSPPNNWLANFGGSAWQWDDATGQYYLHSFLPEQPDLNWRNPELKAAMFDTLRFWLDRGVDGFRIDVAHAIMKDPDLRDNPPNPDAGHGLHKSLGAYDAQLHIHDKGHPDVHGVYREVRALLDAYSAERPRVAIGEIHIFDWAEWARYYGAALDEMHLPFNFGLLGVHWSAQTVRRVVDGLEAALPAGAWPNYVLGNHDEPRIASRIGRDNAPLAMMLLLTLRGTPTIYYGDELGMRDVPIPPEREQDPWGKRVPGLGLGRDPERTPMQWDTSSHAGFCAPDVEPWLPVSDAAARVNVAVELADPGSMLALTRRLLALRRATPALAHGGYRPIDEAPADCFVYLRESDGQRVLIALNFAADERVLALPSLGHGAVVVSTRPERGGRISLDNFSLQGGEGCVIVLED